MLEKQNNIDPRGGESGPLLKEVCLLYAERAHETVHYRNFLAKTSLMGGLFICAREARAVSKSTYIIFFVIPYKKI